MIKSVIDPTMAIPDRPPFWNNLWPTIIGGTITVAIATATALTASSYANGGRDNEAAASKARLDKLETNSVTKDQFTDLKDMVKEIRDDQKEMMKGEKRR